MNRPAIVILFFCLLLPCQSAPQDVLVKQVLSSYQKDGDLREKFQRVQSHLTPEFRDVWNESLTREPIDGFWLDFDPLARGMHYGYDSFETQVESPDTVKVKLKKEGKVRQIYLVKVSQTPNGAKIGNVVYLDGLDVKDYLDANLELSKRKPNWVR